jgi:hypothetical protein
MNEIEADPKPCWMSLLFTYAQSSMIHHKNNVPESLTTPTAAG